MTPELLCLAQACTPYDCIENLEFDWNAWYRRWSRITSKMLSKDTLNNKKFRVLAEALEEYWGLFITRQFFTYEEAFKLCKPCTMPEEGRKDPDNCLHCQKDLAEKSFGKWHSLAQEILEEKCVRALQPSYQIDFYWEDPEGWQRYQGPTCLADADLRDSDGERIDFLESITEKIKEAKEEIEEHALIVEGIPRELWSQGYYDGWYRSSDLVRPSDAKEEEDYEDWFDGREAGQIDKWLLDWIDCCRRGDLDQDSSIIKDTKKKRKKKRKNKILSLDILRARKEQSQIDQTIHLIQKTSEILPIIDNSNIHINDISLTPKGKQYLKKRLEKLGLEVKFVSISQDEMLQKLAEQDLEDTPENRSFIISGGTSKTKRSNQQYTLRGNTWDELIDDACKLKLEKYSKKQR